MGSDLSLWFDAALVITRMCFLSPRAGLGTGGALLQEPW